MARLAVEQILLSLQPMESLAGGFQPHRAQKMRRHIPMAHGVVETAGHGASWSGRRRLIYRIGRGPWIMALRANHRIGWIRGGVGKT